MTTATTTVQVPLTSAQLEAMLAEAKAAEAAAAEAQETDKYAVSGEYIELPASVTKPLLKEWLAAKTEADAAKARLEAAKQAITDVMESHEVLVNEDTGQMLVESRVSTAMVLDTAKLRKEMPEVAAKFQRERRSRSFRVLV